MTSTEPRTFVGHIIHDAHWKPGPNDYYCGRAMPRQGLHPSPFANPYRIGKHGDRAAVLRLFRRYFRESRTDLHPLLPALRGRRLLCFCHTEAGVGDECHADWLAWCADDPERLWLPWKDDA